MSSEARWPCRQCGVLILITLVYSWASPFTDSTTTTGWRILWGPGRATAYSASGPDSLVIFKNQDTRNGASKNAGSWDVNKYKMASIAGPLVSFQHTYESHGSANQGNEGDEFITIDLSQGGARIALGDVFTESDILSRLLNDQFVAKNVRSTPVDLSALFEQIGSGCEMLMNSGDILKSFAFHHVKDSLVAVRLGIPHKCDITQ